MALTWLLPALLTGCDRGDYDGDGFLAPADCDDGDPYTYPGAEEVPYDGKDQDCNGSDLTDADHDGVEAVQVGGPTATTSTRRSTRAPRRSLRRGGRRLRRVERRRLRPRRVRSTGHGGEDCDASTSRITPVDLTGDGTPCSGDCDEGDPQRHEGAEPVCATVASTTTATRSSDRTPVGVLSPRRLLARIGAGPAIHDFGTALVAPGDLDGDGLETWWCQGWGRRRSGTRRRRWRRTAPIVRDVRDAWHRLDGTTGTTGPQARARAPRARARATARAPRAPRASTTTPAPRATSAL
ncbi:MAG: putative metal-binding motif-containing protein [Myxococcota bacterium]